MSSEKNKTVIIVVGPTAVGKTAFAIETAKLMNTQIISADSRQCFRELDIGVAKPDQRQLAEVKHHFINSHSIHDEVNAVVFEQYALSATEKIFEHHETAVMVGGTGLYIKAFCEGLDNIPSIDEAVRISIIRSYGNNGLSWLQQEVQAKDPAFWESAEQQNPQRLMRALEVMESTGKSITHFRRGDKHARPFNIITIGLELPREQLYNQVNRRVDQMVAKGLVNEVRSLLPFRNINALQTVGYRELFPYFDGACSLDAAISEIKKNTRHYAKRQLTWFKKDEKTTWFSPATTPAVALAQVFGGSAGRSFDKR